MVDTGPLVALLNRADRHHDWAKEQLADVRPPVFTCEAVLSEAGFLVRRLPGGPAAVLELVERGLVEVGFDLGAVRALVRKYRDVPISLADACLVRMPEQFPRCEVLTLDQDFRIYRKHRRRPLAVRLSDG